MRRNLIKIRSCAYFSLFNQFDRFSTYLQGRVVQSWVKITQD